MTEVFIKDKSVTSSSKKKAPSEQTTPTCGTQEACTVIHSSLRERKRVVRLRSPSKATHATFNIPRQFTHSRQTSKTTWSRTQTTPESHRYGHGRSTHGWPVSTRTPYMVLQAKNKLIYSPIDLRSLRSQLYPSPLDVAFG